MSTLLNSLDVCESISGISQTIVGLSTCQVNLCQAEQWDICIHECTIVDVGTVCMAILPFYDRSTICETCNLLARAECADAATYTHVEHGTVITSFVDDILCGYVQFFILCDNLLLGGILQRIAFTCHRDIVIREEFLNQVLAGEVAAPIVAGE